MSKDRRARRNNGQGNEPPIRWGLLLVLIAIGFALWLAITNSTYYLKLAQEITANLGLGIVFLTAFVAAAAFFARRYPSSLLSHWNRWLGSLAMTIASWGIVSLDPSWKVELLGGMPLGGRWAQSIVGSSLPLGVAIVSGMALLGLGLISPRYVLRFYIAASRAAVFAIWMALSFIWSLMKLLGRPLRRFKRLRQIPEVGSPLDRTGSPFATEEQVDNEAQRVPGYPPEVARRSAQPAKAPPAGLWERLSRIPPRPATVLQAKPITAAPEKEANTAVSAESRWSLPPISILDSGKEPSLNGSENDRKARVIEETLASFGIETQVVEINPGPTVTQFGLEPGWVYRHREVRDKDREGNPVIRQELISRIRVRVDAITARERDLALALAAPSIRIEAPVPGKSLVGIEVPNASFNTVSLRSIIESQPFRRLKAKSRLALALGRGTGGEEVASDLSQMPHLLIAGATGSGKSVCLNSVISCLLMHNTPDDLRLVLVDPKRVELVSFDGVPHLVTPVIVKTEKVAEILEWAIQEMDDRYRKFNLAGVRNLQGYNQKPTSNEKLPYILIAVDELADLMLNAPVDVEQKVVRLAQLGRATGLHLVLATQRPSVDVITGLIKANFPSRISFAVTSIVDSRVVLDYAGAEKLLGRGDMLFQAQDAQKPKRLQGTYVSDKEIERLTHFWIKQRAAHLYTAPLEELRASTTIPPKAPQDDPLLQRARELTLQYDRVSVNLIQRKLKVGSPKASKILERLEAEGLVSSAEPGKSRQVMAEPRPPSADQRTA